MRRILPLALLATLLLAPATAGAQAIGGNASVTAGAASTSVAFPADRTRYPSVLISPAFGATVEVFYKLGDGTVTAALTDAALPSGGICVNVGPSTNLAVIAASSQVVRLTQLSTCALFAGGSGGGGGGGGGGAVTNAGVFAVQVNQGANNAAVKAASTAPLATDPALVVTLSQNAGLGSAATPMFVSGIGLAVTGASVAGSTASGVMCNPTTSPTGNAAGVWSPLNCVPTTGQLRTDNSTWAGTALGAPSNFGTSPGAVAVPGFNASLFVGTTVADGNSGNKSAGTQRVVLATDQPSLTNALSVISGATSAVNTVAASQSAQVLSNTSGGGTGAAGDYLSHCVVIPTSTSPGVVTILDNATSVFPFPGGATSLSNLVPFTIPVGSKSVSGAWKVTTGANVSVSCVGKFS